MNVLQILGVVAGVVVTLLLAFLLPMWTVNERRRSAKIATNAAENAAVNSDAAASTDGE